MYESLKLVDDTYSIIHTFQMPLGTYSGQEIDTFLYLTFFTK